MSIFSQVLRSEVPADLRDPLGLGVYCSHYPSTTAIVDGAVVADARPIAAWETALWFSRWRLDGKISGGADGPFPTLYVELVGHALRDDEGFLLGSVLWAPQSWSTSEAILQVAGVLAKYWEVRSFVMDPVPGVPVEVGWASAWDRLPGPEVFLGPHTTVFVP